jgi:hypothetical protein
MPAQCAICGETKLEGWSYCPACGHPCPDDDEDEEEDDDDDGDDDD